MGLFSPHINYVYYKIQKDTTYQRLYSLVKDKDYFVMTTYVDGLFVQIILQEIGFTRRREAFPVFNA